MTYQNDHVPVTEASSTLSLGLVAIGLAWAGTILILTTNGVFDVPHSEPALPTLVAIFVPIVVFLAAVLGSQQFRRFLLSLDPVLLTEFQAWRILGGMFLVVMAFGHLPGLFAWPAGLGDVAVGVAAPFIAYRLRQSPEFLTSARYKLFVFVGLADFAVAITLGVASRNEALVGSVTSTAMGQIPLVLIPTFVVPAFIILHLIALLQIREAHKSGSHNPQSI